MQMNFIVVNIKILMIHHLRSKLKIKNFFEGRWEDMYLNFEKILEKKLKMQGGLDVGCGWGLALLYLKDKGLIAMALIQLQRQ